MCGIFGVFHKSGHPARQELLVRAASLLRHRGPDACGVFMDGPLGLAHTRLKIVDLSNAANQPFTDADHALVFNGEIFNADELRRDLMPFHTFRTRSDTEVLFAALCRWREHALPKLDGQYAFAFYHRGEGRLLLARDHVGICPMYVHESADHLAFCSEIRPLLDAFGPSALDPQGVLDYFAYRYNIQNGHTLFDAVRRFPAASFQNVDLRAARAELPVRYWRLCFSTGTELDGPPADAAVLETLDAALERQLTADVPVGLFLSGGIDSRAILHGTARYASTPPDTFTLRMGGGDDGDIRQVAGLRSRYAFVPHEIVWNDTRLRTLPDVVRSLEEPFGDSIVCANALLAAEASRSLRVVLSGEGGDEAFFGYDHQRAFLKLRALENIPGLAALARMGICLTPSFLLRRISGYAGNYGMEEKRHLTRCLEGSLTDAQTYLRLVQLFSPVGIRALLTPKFLRHAPDTADSGPISDIFTEECHPVHASLRVEIEQLTLPLNLMKQDRLCMAYSLEPRVPLVARPVLQSIAAVPVNHLNTSPPKALLQTYSHLARHRKNAFSVMNTLAYRQQTLDLWTCHVEQASWPATDMFRPEALAAGRQGLLAGGLLGIKRALAIVVFLIWRQQFRSYLKI